MDLVIDTNYNCNLDCKYCQWGISNTRRPIIQVKSLFLSTPNLSALNIKRIIFSGGEPLLSPIIEKLISYYSQKSIETCILTNGLLMNKNKIAQLMEKGLNEICFSIDTLNPQNFCNLKGISEEKFKIIKKNIKNASQILEINRNNNQKQLKSISINCTLTPLNCNLKNIKNLLKFCIKNSISSLKFQPVFNDGYLSKNAPILDFSNTDINDIKEIIEFYYDSENNGMKYLSKKIQTNPLGFWINLYHFLQGIDLDPESCSIEESNFLLHEGQLKYCFWCLHSQLGKHDLDYRGKKIEELHLNFRNNLYKCRVLPQCFCLQDINHIWDLNQ